MLSCCALSASKFNWAAGMLLAQAMFWLSVPFAQFKACNRDAEVANDTLNG